MKNNPLVSVITPTYNHENFINQCIASVLNQTYQNWEMIIVDDSSSDKTLSLIRTYLTDPRIKLIHHKYNWGVKRLKVTYNQALRKSKGQLVAILEGDDFWPKDKLATQISSFNKKEVVLSFGDWIMVDRKSRPFNLGYYKILYSVKEMNNALDLFTDPTFYIISSTVMIDKKKLVEIGGFLNSYSYPFVDIPTYLGLTMKGKFVYKHKILGYYRKHKDSTWYKFAQNSSAMGRQEIQNCFWEFIDKNKLVIKQKEIINKQNRYLKQKKRYKFLTQFYHWLVFGNLPITIIISLIFSIRYMYYLRFQNEN